MCGGSQSCADVTDIWSHADMSITFLQPTLGSVSNSHDRWCFGRTNVSELFFNRATSGSVQPINQKAIRSRASGEDHPNLRLVPAFNGSISSPLKIARKRQDKNISKEVRRHLADYSPSWSPDGQMSPNFLFWGNPGNIFLGFVLVVALHANFHKRLKKRLEQQFRFICSKHFRYTEEEWNKLFVLTR